MREIEVSVDGMSCRHCVRSVSAQVSRVVGTGSFSVDLERGRVVVWSAVEGRQVVSAVERAGFGADLVSDRGIGVVHAERGGEAAE